MKTKTMTGVSGIIITIVLFSIVVHDAYALCAADKLEWWEACNDTGSDNALPLNPVLLWIIFTIFLVVGLVGVILQRLFIQTRMLLLVSVLLLTGTMLFMIGIYVFFEIQATEARLESEITAGSMPPIVTYDNVWKYFGFSAVFFGADVFLLIWRKRK